MQFFPLQMHKACEAKHFSSEMCSDMLIYSETDGSISACTYGAVSRIPTGSDPAKKHVKFYPSDNLVFTTTDISGLRVWDRERQKVLYKYKDEHLNDHSYSSHCILASFDDYNIKFYDLRCRYLANSRPLPSNKKVGWIEECVYCFDGECVSVLDYKNLSRPVRTFDNVFDFAICDGVCYLVAKDRGKCYLTYTDPRAGEAHIQKEVPYDRILPLKGQGCIAGVTKDGLRIESYNSLKDVQMKDCTVEALHFGSTSGYCFANGSLFVIGSLKNFCNEPA